MYKIILLIPNFFLLPSGKFNPLNLDLRISFSCIYFYCTFYFFVLFSLYKPSLYISGWPRTHYVAQGGFDLMKLLLPLPLKSWDSRLVSPHWTHDPNTSQVYFIDSSVLDTRFSEASEYGIALVWNLHKWFKPDFWKLVRLGAQSSFH